MKATLKFLQDFYSPLHKKTFVAADPKKNSIEIDVDADGTPIHSFWFIQLKDQESQIKENKDYKPHFELSLLKSSTKIKSE